MRNQMVLIFPLLHELFSAFLTSKWLRTFMTALMTNHVTVLWKALATDFTSKRLLPRMYALMFRQTLLEFEASIAPGTREKITIFMCALVTTKVALQSEILVADLTPAKHIMYPLLIQTIIQRPKEVYEKFIKRASSNKYQNKNLLFVYVLMWMYSY